MIAATAPTQRDVRVQFLLSGETTSAMDDMFTSTLDFARAREASVMWAEQTEALRRGMAILQAGAIGPGKANAMISDLCNSMMDTWQKTMDCDPHIDG